MKTFFQRRFSRAGSRGDLVQSAWEQERRELLESRVEGHFPPKKSDHQLGGSVQLPEMGAFRFSWLKWQWSTNHKITIQAELFCQTFSNGKEYSMTSSQCVRNLDEALFWGQDISAVKICTQMILVDFEEIPNDIDCIIFGVFLPQNCAELLQNAASFSTSGLLEILPVDLVMDNWVRETWPNWEEDSPVRHQLAEQDQLKLEPEFFHKESFYSTYLWSHEVGYCKGFLWGKCVKNQDGFWMFQPIREAVDCMQISDLLPSMLSFLPLNIMELGVFKNHKLLLRTQDPLGKLSLSCLRFDRFGFTLGEVITVGQQNRGTILLDMDSLWINGVTSIWIIYTGESDCFAPVQMKLNDSPQALEFPGDKSCILLRLTSLGIGKPYTFPPPKDDQWVSIPIFRALDPKISILETIQGYQPTAVQLRVNILSGSDLAAKSRFGKTSNAFAIVQFGDTQFKTAIIKKTLNPEWNSNFFWPFTNQWKDTSSIGFHVYHSSRIHSAVPLGMAVYELGSMRLPFQGKLRLRQTGPHERSSVSGHITVLIQVRVHEESQQ